MNRPNSHDPLRHALRATTVGVAVLAGSFLMVSAASGHAVWFAQHAGRLAFIFGLGADDLDAVKRLSHVTSVAGYDASWHPVPTHLKVNGPLVVVDTARPLTVVTAAMYYGIWSKPPGGDWVDKGRDQVPESTVSEKNYKYAVHIIGPLTTPVPPLPHQVLEVVPVGAELPALAGQRLELRVLFHGRPVAGARILRDFVNDPDAEAVASDADGTATIRVRNQGLNVVSATFYGPPDDPKQVDRIEYEATLSFVLPHQPE